MKVLFLGHCSLYTVSNLARALSKYIPGLSVTVANPVKPEGGAISLSELSAFENSIELPRRRAIKLNGEIRIEGIKRILRNDIKRKRLLGSIVRTRLVAAKKLVESEAEEEKYSEKMRSILSGYDVYNFHYPTTEFLTPIKYIERDKKIILTFWGSDLLNTESSDNYTTQRNALDRADIITLNTIEMREIFLAKFGRKYLPKIRQAYFIIDESKFQSQNDEKEVLADNFRRIHGIDKGKVIVSIGYNGSAGQKHIEILRILSHMSKSVKNKIHLVIPLTYGLQFEKKDYAKNVRRAVADTGISFTVLCEYLKNSELRALVGTCDINLNLRDTDCMNAFFLESLYAGNVNITGAWLPYGKLKRLGINFIEIEKREDLLSVIPDVLENLKNEFMKNSSNGKLVKDFFSTDNLIIDWKKIYGELKETSVMESISRH